MIHHKDEAFAPEITTSQRNGDANFMPLDPIHSQGGLHGHL